MLKISFNDSVGIKTIPARCDLESDEPSSDEAPPVRHQEKSLSNYRSRIGKALILKKEIFNLKNKILKPGTVRSLVFENKIPKQDQKEFILYFKKNQDWLFSDNVTAEQLYDLFIDARRDEKENEVQSILAQLVDDKDVSSPVPRRKKRNCLGPRN